jgi:hypothetical protein
MFVFDILQIYCGCIQICSWRIIPIFTPWLRAWSRGYVLGNQEIKVQREADRFWGPSSLLANAYRRIFPRGYSDRHVKLPIVPK